MITSETLERVVSLSQVSGRIYMATADCGGMPHVAKAGSLTLLSDQKRVVFEAWSCPHTVSNLSINRWMALVILPPGKEIGYQLIGWIEELEDVLLMDGLDPQLEARRSVPQAKKRLTMRVDKIIGFRPEAHTDESL
jgi:uncharacterized protein